MGPQYGPEVRASDFEEAVRTTNKCFRIRFRGPCQGNHGSLLDTKDGMGAGVVAGTVAVATTP